MPTLTCDTADLNEGLVAAATCERTYWVQIGGTSNFYLQRLGEFSGAACTVPAAVDVKKDVSYGLSYSPTVGTLASAASGGRSQRGGKSEVF